MGNYLTVTFRADVVWSSVKRGCRVFLCFFFFLTLPPPKSSLYTVPSHHFAAAAAAPVKAHVDAGLSFNLAVY